MISTMEPSRIETISVTSRSKQVHQSQHIHGLESHTNLGGGSTDKIRGMKEIITFRGGKVPE